MINIIDERENPIFERKEVKGEFVASETPLKSKIITELALKYKVKETHIDLKYVVSKRGVQKGEFFALVYNKPIREEEKKDESEGQQTEVEQQEASSAS